jgi:hypothetical protein
MANIKTLGVKEDGTVKYLDIDVLVDENNGWLLIRGYFGSGGLQSYKTIHSNVSEYKKKTFLKNASDYIRAELYHSYEKYNKNIPAQIEISRYAVNIDVIDEDGKERRVFRKNIKRTNKKPVKV